ncbi:aldehyde dehydrogenase family protein [Sphingomonas canadensis]|uniref:aldehyde dehydrogenase (NAD(+)) n=1 Tax=Sphingomonas canadensis TaxID=1219257 RepID=A0ABW3H0F4_9SPHN|nr:aldehyde dehydrogenase family protein [Sphingomonas canadensis]MCW3835139.1 aldehyde dehydrogenase family protein [Sphingomonas canadensis]
MTQLPAAGAEAAALLETLGCPLAPGGRPSPIDGSAMPLVPDAADVDAAIARAAAAFAEWRSVPAPVRGALVRRFGDALREQREPLGRLVAIETGKPLSEGVGEVQEMIDICEFATGLSRQLYGLTIASERPEHHMREMWHPLGPVAIISAFNFPVAVWAWNAAIALVCGDSVIWKPSEKTPVTAHAVHALFDRVAAECGAPAGLSQLVPGGRDTGAVLAADPRIPLVSATGSVPMGRAVAQAVAARLGRSLLELGGNAATIVAPSADLDLAVRAIAFGAAGTTGQRCTTMRRLIVHESVCDALLARLKRAYASLPIGDPRAPGMLVGPLIDGDAVSAMATALERARAEGGTVTGGEHLYGNYVRPALAEMPGQSDLVREETFAPILYVLRYSDFAEAIALQRDVPQGLSSSILTNDLREAEAFLSATGSDCGIANVNMGTSGAEIGGAFGGEKETGGGRESGSDAWKAYMRRQTQNVNFGRSLPLAQGVEFEV